METAHLAMERPDSDRLNQLNVLNAIRIWMGGDFTTGEAIALIDVIKTGTGARIPTAQIINAILDSMNSGESPEQCLIRIREKKAGAGRMRGIR